MNIAIILFVYFLIMLGMGYWTHRKETQEEFMIANRKLKPLSAGISFAVTWLEPPVIFFVVSLAFASHWGVMWFFIAAVIEIALIGLFAPKIRDLTFKKKVYNLSELANKSISRFTGLSSAIITLICYFLWTAMAIYGGGHALATLSGWSFGMCASIISFIAFSYLVFGGFKASIYTDVFQYSWIIVLVIALLIFSKGTGEYKSVTEIKGMFEEGWQANLWMIPLFILSATNCFGVMARLIASESGKSARKASLISFFAQNIPLVMLAYFAYIIATIDPSLEGDAISMYMLTGGFVPEYIIPLTVISFIGLILSTVDTYFLVMSNALMDNVLMSFDTFKKKDYRKMLRISICFCAIIATLVAVYIESITMLFSMGMMLLGCGTPIFFAVVFEKNKSKFAAGFMSLSSMILHLALHFSVGITESTSVIINISALIIWFAWEKLAEKAK